MITEPGALSLREMTMLDYDFARMFKAENPALDTDLRGYVRPWDLMGDER